MSWKEKEIIVAFIEQCICPKAIVKHNVNLPVLNSKTGRTRQCDVVIVEGKEPRETISIVEVQDRGKKVDINMFGGWIDKLREVGAQHLICVSKIGFPESVIEKAEQIGSSVRLIKFEEVKEKEWPAKFLKKTVSNPQRKILGVHDADLHFKLDRNISTANLEFDMNEKCFLINGMELSVFELLIGSLDHHEYKNGMFDDGIHIHPVTLPLPGQKIFYKFEGTFREIMSFTCKLEFSKLNREQPLTCNRYYQFSYDDDLAWIMEAKVEEKGKAICFRQVVIKEGPSEYRLVMQKFGA
jgi:hypothetical protein